VSQKLALKIKGLYTHPNEFSEVPEGALAIANNVNIDRESVAEPRRGFGRGSYGFASSTDRANKFFEYRDTLIAHYGAASLARDTGSAWSDYSGTFSPPDSSTPVRAAEANQNFYFTTSAGVKKLDSPTGTVKDSGAYKGTYISGAITGSSGFLADTYSVAYRIVWGYEDANKNLILGAPSQRAIVKNTAGGAATRNVALDFGIPDGVTTSWLFQVYRSAQTTSDTPSDEMFLVYESNPTSAQITAKAISLTDVTDDDLAGATLYTSPSQETIVAANDTPPFAKDVEVFKNHLFYANIKNKHRLKLTLIAVPDADDALTLNGVTYTFKAATSVGSNQVKRFTAGSVSQNIADTAIELCSVINKSASNTGANAIYAFYISGENDTPGKLQIESRSVGGASYAATWTPASTSQPWQPQLPTSGASISSANDEYINGLAFSKPQQPEAVPLVNIFRVGSADQAILRIIELRDSLFIFKNDGVYRLTGEDAGSFRIELFDGTARLIGPNTAQKLNNSIYFLSDQGVVSCSETGLSVVSRPIESDIVELFGVSLSALSQYSFAVGYESERKYILGLIQNAGDTNATKFYVYNTFTNAWTTWDGLDSRCGFVRPSTDIMYLGDDNSEYLLVERKSKTASDYGDFLTETTLTDVSTDGLTLTLTNSDMLTVGDVIYQSATSYAVVRSIDVIAGTCVMFFKGNLSAGSADVYGGINATVEWVPMTGENPGVAKHFQEIAVLFKKGFRLFSTFGFYSDESRSVEEVEISGPGFGNFGFSTWGGAPWGGMIGRSPKRTFVPMEKARASHLSFRFNHRIAFSDFQMEGVSLIFNVMSERFGV
jgi:hypothetical protein